MRHRAATAHIEQARSTVRDQSRIGAPSPRAQRRATIGHAFPDTYRPVAYCRSCGRDFAGDGYFARHRIGSHSHDFSPERPDGRRCMDDDELRTIGLRPMTEAEMAATQRHCHRLGLGVAMWFNPKDAARAQRNLRQASASCANGQSEALDARDSRSRPTRVSLTRRNKQRQREADQV